MVSDLPLLVIGDIFGEPTPEVCFSHVLTDAVITRQNLAPLAGRPDLGGEALHGHLFETGGMDQAVQGLARAITTPTFALGYSAGGTLLWRLARIAPILGLICISSTRLRDETALPIPSLTIFGEDDPNRPTDHWCGSVPTAAQTLTGASHSFYCDSGSAPYKTTLSLVTETLSHWQAINPSP